MPKVKIPNTFPQRTSSRQKPPTTGRSKTQRTVRIKRYPVSPIPRRVEELQRIAAVDPGITTGLAFRVNEQILTCVGYSDDEVLKMLPKSLEYVVIERFQTGSRLDMYGLATIELVGQLVGWCKCLKIPYEVTTPQSRYPFMTEARGAVGGLIEPSEVAKHEVDALAHLLAWEYRNSQ